MRLDVMLGDTPLVALVDESGGDGRAHVESHAARVPSFRRQTSECTATSTATSRPLGVPHGEHDRRGIPTARASLVTHGRRYRLGSVQPSSRAETVDADDAERRNLIPSVRSDLILTPVRSAGAWAYRRLVRFYVAGPVPLPYLRPTRNLARPGGLIASIGYD